MAEHTSQITLQVQDQEHNAYTIHLAVAAAGTGTLAILDTQGQAVRQFDLAQLQKSRDAKTLTCRVGFATATMQLAAEATPPALHIAARAFLPVFSATYTLSREEQHRLLGWIAGLPLALLA
jgi:hypothetical protein